MGSDHTSLLGQFDRELEAAYRSEVYRVRDNGAVCRQRRPGSRKRPLDDLWTFGIPNRSTGYMHIGTEVVHRIVATAFLGDQLQKSTSSITLTPIGETTASRTSVG